MELKIGQHHQLQYRSYRVAGGIDDSDVAVQCGKNNSIGRDTQRSPQRHSCEPDTTNELVPGAARWHTSAIHIDNSRQDCEDRRTQIYDALIDDENVNFLNNNGRDITTHEQW